MNRGLQNYLSPSTKIGLLISEYKVRELGKNTKHLSAFSLGKIRRQKGSVWYFASGSGFVFCGPARNGGDKAITAVLHIHDIFLTDVPKRNT